MYKFRFIEKRVRIDKLLLRQVLTDIKNYNNFKWNDLSKILKIPERSIRNDWIKKGNTVPLSLFKKLLKHHPNLNYKTLKRENKIRLLDPFWGQRIGNKSRIEHKIKLPDINSKNFAEFYGIMLGDGCIYSNLSGLCITCNRTTDESYLKDYVAKLAYSLFNIKPKIYISKRYNAIRCVLYSKKISKFLINLGFPRGKKISGNLKIPNKFFNNKELISSCIRGLADTDGTICRHPHTKVMISISVLSKSLLKSLINAFDSLNIQAGHYNKGINIYGKEKAHIYFKTVGSSNIKHISKFKEFITSGRMWDRFETETFLSNINSLKSINLPYYGPVV